MNYDGVSLANINAINRQLTNLTAKYPTNKLEAIVNKTNGSAMSASYRTFAVNGKKLGSILSDELSRFQEVHKQDRETVETIKARFEGKKIPFSIQSTINKLENNLKFSRYGVHASYGDHVGCTVIHEYGHIIADQYFGQINGADANPHYSTDWNLRGMAQKWEAAFQRSIDSGDIYSLSKYGRTNVREFFAESFLAREMGEKLPDYVESLMSEVLEHGIM